jgi:hypothetical protein
VGLLVAVPRVSALAVLVLVLALALAAPVPVPVLAPAPAPAPEGPANDSEDGRETAEERILYAKKPVRCLVSPLSYKSLGSDIYDEHFLQKGFAYSLHEDVAPLIHKTQGIVMVRAVLMNSSRPLTLYNAAPFSGPVSSQFSIDMELEHVLAESELLSHADKFGFILNAGKDEFTRHLRNPLNSSKDVLDTYQRQIIALHRNPERIETYQTILRGLKTSEQILIHQAPTESSKVAESQIFFTGEHTKSLNAIPYLVALCVFLKVWIAPALALLSPLLLVLMPYVIMTQVMDMSLTWEMYTFMMKQMVFGIQEGESWKLKHWAQASWTLVSIGQGIVTPFLAAYHTTKLDATIIQRGNALIKIQKAVKYMVDEITDQGGLASTLICPDVPEEPHEAAAWMDQEPLGYKALMTLLGRIDVRIAIASNPKWHPYTFTVDSATDTFTLSNFSDLAITPEDAKRSVLTLGGHSLLTGPNRGGKSSNLRGILQQVLLAQTFGFTYDCVGSWKPFRQIFTRLKSRDTAGKESLFEMEVRYASKIIKSLNKNRWHSLVLVDELFHSTNPPDAEIAAKVFLKQLWVQGYTKSIISTHIFGLCDSGFAKDIQQLRCDAKVRMDTSIEYSYVLSSGICRVSSVREVLEESGLLT